MGVTHTVWSIEIVPRGGPPLKIGGPPLELINLQPKKGGLPLEFINIHLQNGSLPLGTISVDLAVPLGKGFAFDISYSYAPFFTIYCLLLYQTP